MRIKINLKSAEEIIKQKGLEPGGKVQLAFAESLLFYGDKRTPKQENSLLNSAEVKSGNLINSVEVKSGGREIYYPGPYARYLWYGVAMEGKPPMHPTNRPLQFQESPTRGEKWLIRTWQDDGNKILQELANMVGGKVK